jgi:phosphoribosylamine--glycine ligase
MYYAPNKAEGNPGIDVLPKSLRCSQLAQDIEGIAAFCQSSLPDLVVVGPEQPLGLGIADKLRAKGLNLNVVGPNADGARLETSKQWAKDFMQRWNIPTAHSEVFTEVNKALDFLQEAPAPFVLKADGLAAGKGVLVTENRAEAIEFAQQVMEQKIFGEAGSRLLVEEFLQGLEVSVLALCDTVSNTIIPLEPACDYKRALDGDQGLNTGGMGAYSPTQMLNEQLSQQVYREILEPTLNGLRQDKIDYRGIVYAGLMLTANGPKVLEYNCRMGDPETQSLLPRLKTDLLEVFDLLAQGRLNQAPKLEWDTRLSCGVVLAAPGYPGSYPKGLTVEGLENFNSNPTSDEILVFHAGTTAQAEFLNALAQQRETNQPIKSTFFKNNQISTDGGRVFNVVALGHTIKEARQRVYGSLAAGKLSFEGVHYRHDIASREEN